MSAIIDFFKMVVNGLAKMVSWIMGAPALLASAVVSLYSTVSTVIGSVSSGGDHISDVVQAAQTPITTITDFIQSMPEICRVGIYCLSLDVAFDFVLVAFGAVTSLVVIVLTFVLITIPLYLAEFYTLKFSAWFMAFIFPKSLNLSGMSAVMNMKLVLPSPPWLKYMIDTLGV